MRNSPRRCTTSGSTSPAEGFEGPFGTPQEVEVPHSLWWLMLLPLVLLL